MDLNLVATENRNAHLLHTFNIGTLLMTEPFSGTDPTVAHYHPVSSNEPYGGNSAVIVFFNSEDARVTIFNLSRNSRAQWTSMTLFIGLACMPCPLGRM